MAEILQIPVPQAIDAEELSAILALLPAWRRSKALAFRQPLDRWLCAKAWLLLQEGLEKYYGVRDEDEFTYGPHGKPSLKNHPEIHFSISHCRTCVACAVSDSPVGLDVECYQFDPDLAREVCSEEELAGILASNDPKVEFTKLWTKKESYLKLTGEGLRNDLRNLLTPSSSLTDTSICSCSGSSSCSPSAPVAAIFTQTDTPTHVLTLAE